MDKTEYIIKQLGRTKNKKFEAYVVYRIINLLDDFDIKFVTQQYVSRPDGRALTDLFFPQFGIHIEVDEGQHFTREHIESDKVREADIVNATGHQILRVDVTKSIDNINDQIDDIVATIQNAKAATDFEPWNIDAEFLSQTYIDLGYIDVSDNVAFKTIKDACNCFGHQYEGYQRAGASHPDNEIMLWFPKLYANGEWNNQISDDEETIVEKHEDAVKAKEHVLIHLNNPETHKHKRIVFARVKGSLGDVLYRFRGEYSLDRDSSNALTGLVWRRTKTKVNTYR